MELSETLEGSLQIKKILEQHNSMYKPMYKNIQEIFRILWKALDSSHAFHNSVKMCGHL